MINRFKHLYKIATGIVWLDHALIYARENGLDGETLYILRQLLLETDNELSSGLKALVYELFGLEINAKS